MALSNTPSSWGSLSRALHWLMALLILTNIGLGLYTADLPRSSDAEIARLASLYSAHKTLGIAALGAALIRILWTLTQARPTPLHPGRRLETFLAEATHWSLYLAILIMPLSGWLGHASSEGFAPILWPFGQSLPFLPNSPTLSETFFAIHGAAAKLLVLSLILHIAGAAKHAIIDRDGLLARMVTGRPAGGAPAPTGPLAKLAATVAWAAIVALGLILAPTPSGETASPQPGAGNWAVGEGAITFAVRQMAAEIKGTIPSWTADIRYDEATRTGHVAVTMPLSGMTLGAVTQQAAGPEFFDIARFPTAIFTADIAEADGQLLARGPFTLHGKEVPLALPFTLTIEDDRATMTGEVTLDRRDFGMGPSFPDETTVGFAVRVNVALTATRQ